MCTLLCIPVSKLVLCTFVQSLYVPFYFICGHICSYVYRCLLKLFCTQHKTCWFPAMIMFLHMCVYVKYVSVCLGVYAYTTHMSTLCMFVYFMCKCMYRPVHRGGLGGSVELPFSLANEMQAMGSGHTMLQ